MTDGKKGEGAGADKDAEELVANALRAHAARTSVPHDRPPSAQPEDPQPAEPPPDDEADTEATSTVEPVNEQSATTMHTVPVAEQTTGTEPEPLSRLNTGLQVEARDRMLAPHDVDSSREIEAELGALQATDERPLPAPPRGTRLPVRWVLLLAVLLGLAAGAIAGLLTVL